MSEELYYHVGDGKRCWIMQGQPKMYSEGGTITSRTCGYKTEEELRDKLGVIVCATCGDEASTNYMEPLKSRLLSTRQCFRCDFWTHEIKPETAVVIEGDCFWIGPVYPKGYKGFLGFGGREFHIEFNDGRQVVTNNLWSNGTVPERFRERLPDNARFTNGEGWVDTDGRGGKAMNAGPYLNGRNRN